MLGHSIHKTFHSFPTFAQYKKTGLIALARLSVISHFARRSVHSKAIALRGADVENVTNIQKRLTRTLPVA